MIIMTNSTNLLSRNQGAKLSLSDQLREALLRDFVQGKWSVGKRIATEQELCKKYSISRITVRRAMEQLERSGVIRRIQGRGTFLLQKPEVARKDPPASSTGRKAGTLLFLVPTARTNPYINTFMEALRSICEDKGIGSAMCSSGTSFDAERRALSELDHETYFGACIMPHWGHENAECYFELKRSGFPFVLIDLYFKELLTDRVGYDDEQIGYEQTRHVIGAGHKDIAFMRSLPCSAIEDRLAGYRRALSEANLPYYESLVQGVDVRREADTMQNGSNITEELMRKPRKPSAIILESDMAAAGAVLALRQMNCRVPQDVAVVGAGDFYTNGEAVMPLTTVRLPVTEVVRKGVEVVLQRIEQPDLPLQEIRLPGELVVRESSKPGG